MPQPNQCPFCQLDRQTNRIIRTDSYCRSFLSDPRLTRGHVLVVPVRHLDDPNQLNQREVEAVFNEVKRLRAKLLESVARGVDCWQKTRPDVPEGTGYKVNHVHFHVLPSNPGEELYEQSLTWTKDKFRQLSQREREEMAALLRS